MRDFLRNLALLGGMAVILYLIVPDQTGRFSVYITGWVYCPSSSSW